MTPLVRGRDEEGAVLVLVLVFLGAVGLVILALLTQTGVGVKSTVVVSDFGKKLYSADSALDVALEAVQNDTTLCPEKSDDATTISSGLAVDTEIDAVTVTCRTTAGSAGGFAGYAIITTDPNSLKSLETQSSGPKTVTGPVFVAGGEDLQKQVVVEGGNYIHAGTQACPTSSAVQVTAPNRIICGPRATPNTTLAVPAAPAIVNPAVNTTSVPGCNIFSPGTYTNKPVLADRNYFRSGTYHFTFADIWDINKVSVVGGTAGTQTTYLDAPCFAESSPAQTGVTWVFRGTSRLQLQNQARVELYAPPAASPGLPRVSIYVEGTRPAGPAVNQVTGNVQIVVHGGIYSPGASIKSNATGTVSFLALNGVVASEFLLQSVGDGFLVSTEGGATPRSFVLEAIAKKGSDGRTIKARAVGDRQLDGKLRVFSRWSQ